MNKLLLISTCIILTITSFAQKIKIISANDSVPFIQLNEVTVKGLIKNQDQQIKDFIIANKAATTEDILARFPEINMIRRGSYGTEPLIRTYNTGQVNVLIDGMRIHGACTDKMDPATIYVEPQNLQNIQVNTKHGTQSGSCIGGTIDLKLVEPDSETTNQLSGYISSGYQTAAKSFYETGMLNYTKKRWSIRTNISYRKASDYKSGGGITIPYSSYEKINYGISAKYLLNNQYSIKADILMDDGWNIGYPALPMDVGYAAARIAAISLIKEKSNTKWFGTEYKIYANSIYHLMDDTHRKNVAMHMDMPGHSKTFGGYMNTNLQLSSKQNIHFRADISSTDLMASMTMYQNNQSPMFMLTWPDNRSIQSGLSATYKNYIDSITTITLSTRIDQFINSLKTQAAKDQLSILQEPTETISKTLKNISVELSHYINPHLKGFVVASYAERMPTASELYGFYLFNAFDNFDYIGNTLLKKENALKADLGVVYTKPKLQLSFSVFASKVNNYILGIYDPTYSTMTIGAQGVKLYRNIPYAQMTGLEAGIISKLTNNVQLISTFKYNYGRDHYNNPLPLIAPFKNITSLKKQIKNWSFQFETETAAAQNRVSVDAKENTTNGFFIANTRSSYSGILYKKAYRIDVGVENIFDKAYKEHLDWGNINRPGRNIYIQISFAF
ncbi:MAG: TonB-dependent receptor [Bacteroidetes bacterium]|nr:TonB-dependent receptor [Bacteroidota bacterium]